MPKTASVPRKQATAYRTGVGGDQVRDRVQFACTYCRIRRIKCSGATPCDNCATRMLSCVYEPVTRSNSSRRKSKVKAPHDSPFSPITDNTLANSQGRYASSISDGAEFIDNSDLSVSDASPGGLPLTPHEPLAKDSTIHPLMSEAQQYPSHARFLPSVLEHSEWLHATASAGDVPWVGPITEDTSEEGSKGSKAKRWAFAVADAEEQPRLLGWAHSQEAYPIAAGYCSPVYASAEYQWPPTAPCGTSYGESNYWTNDSQPSLVGPSVNDSYTASPADGTLPSSLADTGPPPSPYTSSTQGMPPCYQFAEYEGGDLMQNQADLTGPLLPSSKSIEGWVDFDAAGALWSTGDFPQAETEL